MYKLYNDNIYKIYLHVKWLMYKRGVQLKYFIDLEVTASSFHEPMLNEHIYAQIE